LKKRQIKRIILSVLGLLVFAFLVLVYSVKFRMSDEEVREKIADDNTNVIIDYHLYEDRSVRNILVNRGNDRLFILLHGAPSSSAQWVPLVNDSLLSRQVDFLMIDRPGYGYSDFGEALTSVQKQAKIVFDITRKHAKKYNQILMLGTSYGGTVAARFMMDYPAFLDGGILMSSSVAPGQEKTYAISYFMDRVPWLFPKLLMVANDEKLSHKEELEKMEPLWQQIDNPILFIHATADGLVYPGNVSYALKRLCPDLTVDTTWVKDGEHSLYWSDRKLVFNELYDFVRQFKIKKETSFASAKAASE